MRTFLFRVADHLFIIETAHDLLACCPNYAAFREEDAAEPLQEGARAPTGDREQPVFTLRVSDEPLLSLSPDLSPVYIDRSDEDMPRIEMYKTGEGWMFRFSQSRDGEIVGVFTCDETMAHAVLYGEATRFAVDNTLMLLYAFTTAHRRTLLFHASVIVRGQGGYLFLGKSGTGKSTHAEQWLKRFADAERLNDDNPVVRVGEDGVARVYGSPWSGKTPCYKAGSAPVRALVQLAQAPRNEIRLLRPTQAYPYILASVSGLKMVPAMMDSLYESMAALLESTPVYFLDCLPNIEAAEVCYSHLPH